MKESQGDTPQETFLRTGGGNKEMGRLQFPSFVSSVVTDPVMLIILPGVRLLYSKR